MKTGKGAGQAVELNASAGSTHLKMDCMSWHFRGLQAAFGPRQTQRSRVLAGMRLKQFDVDLFD